MLHAVQAALDRTPEDVDAVASLLQLQLPPLLPYQGGAVPDFDGHDSSLTAAMHHVRDYAQHRYPGMFSVRNPISLGLPARTTPSNARDLFVWGRLANADLASHTPSSVLYSVHFGPRITQHTGEELSVSVIALCSGICELRTVGSQGQLVPFSSECLYELGELLPEVIFESSLVKQYPPLPGTVIPTTHTHAHTYTPTHTHTHTATSTTA